MLYLYSKPMCSACEAKKREFNNNKILYVERSANRLNSPVDDYDDVDKEALVILNMQNMALPVVVEV